jgi:hypothetical protein
MAEQKVLRRIEYRDSDGRLSLRLIPYDAPDEDAVYGVLVGPPPLTGLGLPLEIEVKLQNELYHRGLLTEKDIRKRRYDAAAAVMAACRLDVDRILAAIHVKEEPDASNGVNPAVIPVSSVHNRRRSRSS